MAVKLDKSSYPKGHTADDFQCFGPVASKDGDFSNTMMADLGCFAQGEVDSNKFYFGCVCQSKKNQNWYVFFEWGRTGNTNNQFQMVECYDKSDAQRAYEDQMHEKNDKRGVWNTHPKLGRILEAKPGKDVYLVRQLATRTHGLPDARTITQNAGAKPVAALAAASTVTSPVVKKIAAPKADAETIKLLRDLQVGTMAYTRASMSGNTIPSQAAIDEARTILDESLKAVKRVGDDVKSQVADKELMQLTSMLYSRIPKKKDRSASAEDWILSKNNILGWRQDLDAFEGALSSATVTDDQFINDPYNGMKLQMEWLAPKSKLGEFIYNWMPGASRNVHAGIGRLRIKNAWVVNREEEPNRLMDGIKNIVVQGKVEKPLHQPTERIDTDSATYDAYKMSGTHLLFHGTRSCNLKPILATGLKQPKELVGVAITGAMFSGGGGGLYFADDWRKSANYTSLSSGYYSQGNGGIAGRGAFMFLTDVCLGKPYIAPNAYPYIEPPKGHHSIFGKAGVSGVMNNEFIIFKTSNYRFRYLVEFEA